MKKLTAQQEKFCRLVAEGMYQSDAYREAYPNSKATAKTIREKASRLMAQDNISTTVSLLKEELNRKSLWTREEAVKRLMGLLDDDDSRKTDIINAIKELNKMSGFEAPQKIDHSSSDGSMSPTKIVIVGKEEE